MSNGSPWTGWLVASALGLVVFAAPSPAGDLWEDVAKRVSQKHGKKAATEDVCELENKQVT